MKLDLATATTKDIQIAKGVYPVAVKCYLVALWNSRDRCWQIRNAQWNTLSHAEKWANEICLPQNHFTYYTIIEIELPGAKDDLP